MTMNELLKGEIPFSLEEKTLAAKDLLYLSKRIVPVTSLLIASARRDNFENDTSSWTSWCRENLEMDGSDRDHRRAIGDMLLDTRAEEKVYDTLFFLPFDKLLSLTRIPAGELAAFLSHYRVKNLKREEVRDAVAQWRGEEIKERNITEDLPGFSAALGAITAMTPDAVCIRVSDANSANMALRASFRLLGASLNYHKTFEKNVEFLQQMKLELMDEVRGLEQAINECCTQQSDPSDGTCCCTQQSDQSDTPECCTQQPQIA